MALFDDYSEYVDEFGEDGPVANPMWSFDEWIIATGHEPHLAIQADLLEVEDFFTDEFEDNGYIKKTVFADSEQSRLDVVKSLLGVNTDIGVDGDDKEIIDIIDDNIDEAVNNLFFDEKIPEDEEIPEDEIEIDIDDSPFIVKLGLPDAPGIEFNPSYTTNAAPPPGTTDKKVDKSFVSKALITSAISITLLIIANKYFK